MAIVTKPENPFLLHALHYALELRWRVFPIKPRAKQPPLTKHGFHDASSDEKQIRAWWTRWPNANIGIATGDKFWALDIDPRHGGDDSLAELVAKHGAFAQTLVQRTGGGGSQWLYQMPDQAVIKNATEVCGWKGIDVRGSGGYIVVPPSIHPSGQAYRWDDPEQIVSPPDAWLIEAVCKKNGNHSDHQQAKRGPFQLPTKIPHGKQHDYLVSEAGKLRSMGLEYAEILAALWATNQSRCEKPGPREAIEQYARSVCNYAAGKVLMDEPPPPTVVPWPEPLHPHAFYGVAGDLVRILEPHTEADPAALLLQFMAAWGSMIGRGPYYLVEADYHHTNLYVVVVGATSKGRKGTSWGRIRAVLATIDNHWVDNCIIRGLGSGEGLIDALGGNETDKRCLVQEAELARILAIVSREGTTLSAVIRDAYDTGSLSITTRQKKVSISGAHVSLVAHISRDELRRRLDDTEIANGFANRMLWTCAKRSQELPEGGGNPEWGTVIRRLSEATDFARRMGNTRVKMDDAARALWRDNYHDLSSPKAGLLGDVTNRLEANTIRTSLIYALLDQSEAICEPHLRAGLAVVSKYCLDSARYIWGDSLGDPVADEILRTLRSAGTEGLTRWDLVNHFGRNKSAGEIDRAIGTLTEHGLIRFATQESGGRPITRYWAL
jgi:hypothetical protein